MVAWQDAGRPETDAGSTGQQRQHHLAAAVERAERHFAGLTAKVERAANRRLPRNRIPEGAVVVRRLVGGGSMIAWRERLWQQSVLDPGQWVLSWPELNYDAGDTLRWVDEDGVPVFHAPPPTRSGQEITEREATGWAELRGVPVDALLDWYQRPDRRSRLTVRDDVDIPRFGLESRSPRP
jgi:hypothetical protein